MIATTYPNGAGGARFFASGAGGLPYRREASGYDFLLLGLAGGTCGDTAGVAK